MTKISKPKAPTHLVVPDTNILWHKDKSLVVAPEFEKFWEANSGLIDIQLVVPEVVIGELAFQQATSARKALDVVDEKFRHISSITNEKHSHRITHKRIRRQVEKRLEKWVKQLRVRVEPTPLAAIDWREVVEQAIWRLPPFSADASNPELEKGFRDALILATVMALVQREAGAPHVVFLSADYLLRTTAEKRLVGHLFAAYESLEEFESYIKLTREALTAEFVDAIVPRASQKFWKHGDPNSLFYREDVLRQIHERFGSRLEEPSHGLSHASILYQATWSPVSEERVSVSKPQFVELVGDRVFHWKSVVRLVRLFRRSMHRFYLGQSGRAEGTEEHLRIARVTAKWHATVKADGRFYDLALDDLQLDQEFHKPRSDELRRLGFAGTQDQ